MFHLVNLVLNQADNLLVGHLVSHQHNQPRYRLLSRRGCPLLYPLGFPPDNLLDNQPVALLENQQLFHLSSLRGCQLQYQLDSPQYYQLDNQLDNLLKSHLLNLPSSLLDSLLANQLNNLLDSLVSNPLVNQVRNLRNSRQASQAVNQVNNLVVSLQVNHLLFQLLSLRLFRYLLAMDWSVMVGMWLVVMIHVNSLVPPNLTNYGDGKNIVVSMSTTSAHRMMWAIILVSHLV